MTTLCLGLSPFHAMPKMEKKKTLGPTAESKPSLPHMPVSADSQRRLNVKKS